MAAPVSLRGHEKGALAVMLLLLCLLITATSSHQLSTHGHHDYRNHHRERRSLSSSRMTGGSITTAWATQVGKVGWLPGMRQTARVNNKDYTCSATTKARPGGRAPLSMKARGKKGRAAGAAGVGGATATVGGRGGGTKKGKKKRALYIQIEDLESDSWR